MPVITASRYSQASTPSPIPNAMSIDTNAASVAKSASHIVYVPNRCVPRRGTIPSTPPGIRANSEQVIIQKKAMITDPLTGCA